MRLRAEEETVVHHCFARGGGGKKNRYNFGYNFRLIFSLVMEQHQRRLLVDTIPTLTRAGYGVKMPLPNGKHTRCNVMKAQVPERQACQ
jgi:hypothetical protein